MSEHEKVAALPLDDELRRILDGEIAAYRANPSQGMSEEEFHQAARALREEFAARRKNRG